MVMHTLSSSIDFGDDKFDGSLIFFPLGWQPTILSVCFFLLWKLLGSFLFPRSLQNVLIIS